MKAVYIYTKMTIAKSKIECCFNCTKVRVDIILSGLEVGELPCKHYPPKLSKSKDMLKVFWCEEYNRNKVNTWKIAKKRRQMIGVIDARPGATVLPSGMRMIPISNAKELNEFFKKLFGI